jgi:hypothetical protein
MTMALRVGLILVCLSSAVTAQAVHMGWQMLPDGGIEYLVQVEPDLVDSFIRDGGCATSELPPTLRDIRSIRILVGNEKLPNQDNLAGPPQSPTAAASENQKPAANFNNSTASPAAKESVTTEAPTSNSSQKDANTGAPTDWNQSPADRSKGDTAAATSPTADQTLPPIPFLHSSMGRHPAGNNPSTLNQTAKVDDPRLRSDEGPHDGGTAAENYRVVDANKPPVSNSSSQNGGATEAATPKPWWALMAALLALFGSLGANVYLVWIHQAVRAKYRSLLQRSPLGGVAA